MASVSFANAFYSNSTASFLTLHSKDRLSFFRHVPHFYLIFTMQVRTSFEKKHFMVIFAKLLHEQLLKLPSMLLSRRICYNETLENLKCCTCSYFHAKLVMIFPIGSSSLRFTLSTLDLHDVNSYKVYSST